MSAVMTASAPVRAAAIRRLHAILAVPTLLLLSTAQAVTLPTTDSTASAGSGGYRQECSACHLAYPPELLSPRAWQRLIAGLAKHFGTDASLEPPAARAIEAWLMARADPSGADPADGRITHTHWFRQEHGELRDSVWKRPAVRSASNCSACHRGAEQGDFDEDRIHVPR